MCPQTTSHLVQGDRLLGAALRDDGEIMQVFQQTLVLGERQDHSRLFSRLVYDVPLTKRSHQGFHIVCPPLNLAPVGAQRRLIELARYPAPKPLSMLTTATLGAQLFSIPSRAARPLKLAP